MRRSLGGLRLEGEVAGPFLVSIDVVVLGDARLDVLCRGRPFQDGGAVLGGDDGGLIAGALQVVPLLLERLRVDGRHDDRLLFPRPPVRVQGVGHGAGVAHHGRRGVQQDAWDERGWGRGEEILTEVRFPALPPEETRDLAAAAGGFSLCHSGAPAPSLLALVVVIAMVTLVELPLLLLVLLVQVVEVLLWPHQGPQSPDAFETRGVHLGATVDGPVRGALAPVQEHLPDVGRWGSRHLGEELHVVVEARELKEDKHHGDLLDPDGHIQGEVALHDALEFPLVELHVVARTTAVNSFEVRVAFDVHHRHGDPHHEGVGGGAVEQRILEEVE